MGMPLEKIIVTLLAGYLAGSVINFLADKLPSPYVKQANNRAIRIFDYLLPWLIHLKSTAGWRARHWIILFIVPILFVGCTLIQSPVLQPHWTAVVLFLFTLISVIDIEHHFILRPMILAGYILSLAIGIFLRDFIPTITGFLGGFVPMLAFFLLGKLFSVKLSKNIEKGEKIIPLGFGDVHLGGIIGLLLGWPSIIPGIVLAVLSAGLYAASSLLIMVISRNYQPYKVIPYAPFLLGAAILLLCI